MDFAPTEAQRELAELTGTILADQCTPARARELDAEQDRFDRTLWHTLAAANVLDAALPEHAGGTGLGVFEQCGVLVELGRAVAPVPYLMSVVVAANAIARFGTVEQTERWARPAGTGQVVLTAALTEEGETDPTTPRTTAERLDGRWVLNGGKTAVIAGPVADFVLVPATTPDGVAVFVVSPTDEGVHLERQWVVDSDSEALIRFTDVALDRERLLGGSESPSDSGATREIVDWMHTRATLGLCAHQLGVTERALELTAEYAKQRVQFDRPIGGFQAVAHRLADSYVDVEAIRLTLWQAVWRVAEGLPCTAEVATAKFWASDAGHRLAHTAVHVHGGVGLDLDHHLHRFFVAAKRDEFALGGAHAQLRRIGTVLAENPDRD